MKLLIFILAFLLLNTNADSQWIEQQSGVSVSLNCVSSLLPATSTIHGWVCGNNGTVLVTTNGGTNWINRSSNIPVTVNLTTILGFNGSTLRAITAGVNSSNTAVVYFTSNGGLSWQNTFSQPNGNIYGFAEISIQYNILLVGKPLGGRWSIWRSTNTGQIWDSAGLMLTQAGSESGFNNSVHALEGRVWFGTNNSRIYYSPDNAVSWTVQSTSPEVNTSVLWFQYLLTDNSLIGIGLTGSNTLLKTSNLGMNWSIVSTIGSGTITGIAGSPSEFHKSWYSIGSNIYTGINGGAWVLEYNAPNGIFNNLTNNKLGSPNVWGVRNNGGISKYTGSTGIYQISNEIPKQFSLSQNYPNPFNPITNFEFQIPNAGFVEVKVFDVLGNELINLVNENLSVGLFRVQWDASNYPSGVYYYRLSSGEFSETKKMILIK